MKHNSILPVLFATLTLMGCKWSNGESGHSDNTEMARADYVVEKNPVSVIILERTTFNKQLVCNGKLEAGERASLQFSVSGILEKVNVHDGQKVQKGQVLASLDREQLGKALEQARLNFDKAELLLADRLLDYGYTLADTGSIPQDQKRVIYINTGYADARMALENAEHTYSESELKAPFAGKVASVRGRVHEPAGQLCTLINDSQYLVRFNVLETECGLVSVGQSVSVSPFVDPELVLTGSVVSVNPCVDQYGQIAVTARIPGSDRLMDGMNVRITVDNRVPNQLVVPKSAVVIRDNMEVVFRYADGKSQWVYVNVIKSNSTQHVIEPNRERGAKLNEGDLIITSGNLNLADETPVEVHL